MRKIFTTHFYVIAISEREKDFLHIQTAHANTQKAVVRAHNKAVNSYNKATGSYNKRVSSYNKAMNSYIKAMNRHNKAARAPQTLFLSKTSDGKTRKRTLKSYHRLLVSRKKRKNSAHTIKLQPQPYCIRIAQSRAGASLVDSAPRIPHQGVKYFDIFSVAAQCVTASPPHPLEGTGGRAAGSLQKASGGQQRIFLTATLRHIPKKYLSLQVIKENTTTQKPF